MKKRENGPRKEKILFCKVMCINIFCNFLVVRHIEIRRVKVEINIRECVERV